MFKKFIQAQCHKIDIEKWDEGIIRNADPGEEFIMQWISENAELFRYLWNHSICQYCKNEDCNYKTVNSCNLFKESNES
jgi:hypothetical protein